MRCLCLAMGALAFAAAANKLPVVPLNDGTTFPAVSLGVAGYNDTETAAALVASASQGLLAFDTAWNYYNQRGVGQGIKEILAEGTYARKDLYVTSKVSPCIHPSKPSYNITDPIKCYQQTWNDLKSDLSQLQLSRLDMVLLHGPNHHGDGSCVGLANELDAAQWRALQDFRTLGFSTSIGVSNYCPSCLEALAASSSTTTTPAINQIAHHVGMGDDPDGIITFCKKHGIVVQAYSPLAQGKLVNDPVVASVAKNYPMYSTPQVALRWIVQQGLVLTAKANNPQYIAEDIAIFQVNLTVADMAILTNRTTPAEEPSWGCSK